MRAPGPKLECNCIPPGSSIAINIIFLLNGQPSKDRVQRKSIKHSVWESCIVVYLLYGGGFTLFSLLLFRFTQRHPEIILSQTNEGGRFVPNLKCLNTILTLEVSTKLLFSWQHITTVMMWCENGLFSDSKWSSPELVEGREHGCDAAAPCHTVITCKPFLCR